MGNDLVLKQVVESACLDRLGGGRVKGHVPSSVLFISEEGAALR